MNFLHYWRKCLKSWNLNSTNFQIYWTCFIIPISWSQHFNLLLINIKWIFHQKFCLLGRSQFFWFEVIFLALFKLTFCIDQRFDSINLSLIFWRYCFSKLYLSPKISYQRLIIYLPFLHTSCLKFCLFLFLTNTSDAL